MKLITSLALVLGLGVLPATAEGNSCSTRTIRGYWGYTCSGHLTPAPGQPLSPTKILGTCKSTAGGYFTCEGTVSLGGMILIQGLTGQATVSEDCTGTIKYTQTIMGQPAPDLNIRYLILEGGSQIEGSIFQS